jgi:hypothetical protein
MLRLALLYALLDGAAQITAPHIVAAQAVWQFCESSAGYIFAETTSDHTANEIMNALKDASPDGIGRTNLMVHTFGRRIQAHELTRALKKLEAAGKIRREKHPQPSRGRPVELWFAT